MKEQKFAMVPLEAAQAIGNYLLSRPMGEVEGLVIALRAARVINESQKLGEMENEPQGPTEEESGPQ
jgi:hypothetical protein